ncbi:hypothetical protein CJ738_34180, partial [Klebsiella pneumoniae]
GWVQRQGGSVNATTLARHSAFFFEVAADALADGVARLQEMLQAPLGWRTCWNTCCLRRRALPG